MFELEIFLILINMSKRFQLLYIFHRAVYLEFFLVKKEMYCLILPRAAKRLGLRQGRKSALNLLTPKILP